MPELPEVETIVRSLSSKLRGHEVSSSTVFSSHFLRNTSPFFLRRLRRRKVVDMRRRGKLILLDFEDNLSLVFHLKMTGQFFFSRRREPRDKHTHFVLTFKSQERELRFRDVRKFGFLIGVKTSEAFLTDELGLLGPEPLEIDFFRFKKLFQGRKARLKSLLLDQTFIAGIGNIYADEILFQAKLHPLIPAPQLTDVHLKRLSLATKDVLNEAIRCKGSSIRDYLDDEGERGNFQDLHRVYGREALPCFICGEAIRRIRMGGRSSFFCPRCQKSRSVRAKRSSRK